LCQFLLYKTSRETHFSTVLEPHHFHAPDPAPGRQNDADLALGRETYFLTVLEPHHFNAPDRAPGRQIDAAPPAQIPFPVSNPPLRIFFSMRLATARWST
jgi:hypothetical protein